MRSAMTVFYVSRLVLFMQLACCAARPGPSLSAGYRMLEDQALAIAYEGDAAQAVGFLDLMARELRTTGAGHAGLAKLSARQRHLLADWLALLSAYLVHVEGDVGDARSVRDLAAVWRRVSPHGFPCMDSQSASRNEASGRRSSVAVETLEQVLFCGRSPAETRAVTQVTDNIEHP